MAGKKQKTDIFDLADIPGLGDISIAVLNKQGIFTKTDLLCSNPVEVADYIKKDRVEVGKMFEYCHTLLEDAELKPKRTMTAWEVLQERLKVEHITTGCSAFDDILGNGVECKSITEVYGQFGSGKTQLAHQMCLMVQQLKEDGGLSEKDKPARVLYIDTEKTFRPERIVIIGKARGLIKTDADSKKYLENIIKIEAMDASHQLLIVKNTPVVVREANIRLIVVDSGTALFRAEMNNLGNMGRKFQQLNEMLHRLQNIATNYNAAVLFCNQVYSSPEMGKFGDQAYGGNIVGHGTTYRINLTKHGKRWVAEIIDSPMHGKDECEFQLTEKGFVNFEKKK